MLAWEMTEIAPPSLPVVYAFIHLLIAYASLLKALLKLFMSNKKVEQ